MSRTNLKKRQRKQRRANCSSQKAIVKDRIAAELFLATHKNSIKSGGTSLLQGAYRCPECHFWHLTSQK